MDRPTKEQVERALAVVDDVASTSGDEHGKLEVSAILLAAEVRALRATLELVAKERDKRMATIARVEALLTTTAFGRSKPEPVHEHAVITARALRAALAVPCADSEPETTPGSGAVDNPEAPK